MESYHGLLKDGLDPDLDCEFRKGFVGILSALAVNNGLLMVWLTAILNSWLSQTYMVEALNLADGHLWNVQMISLIFCKVLMLGFAGVKTITLKQNKKKTVNEKFIMYKSSNVMPTSH